MITLSKDEKGLFGIVGHVGVGHVHSHSGFVQDDSAGFAAASRILKQAVETDTTIAAAYGDADADSITVKTASGGVGTVCPRRGVTPSEAEILKTAIGLDASLTQNVAVDVFGRIYGQGAAEVPVALQGACALAVLDSFKKTLGGKLLFTTESFPNKYDVFAGTVIEIDKIPVSLMLVINGTNGGIGPDEDYEGNTNYTEKGELMKKLGLTGIPSVVIESKAFIPAMADSVFENMHMVRAQEDVDCEALGEALFCAGKELGFPIRYEKNLMPMPNGSLAKATRQFADSVIAAATKLRSVDSADEKTRLTAELAKLISEDAGGVTFMSNSVNDVMRGAGTLPGISAVLSMVTTREYCAHWKIPRVEETDLQRYCEIIVGAIKKMNRR